MLSLFNLRNFRVLSLGGAKARTNGGEGKYEEEIELFYDVP